MMQRPKCFIEGCNKGAMLMLCGQYICGDCYMEMYEIERLEKIKNMQALLKK